MWRFLSNCVRETLQRSVNHAEVRCGAGSRRDPPEKGAPVPGAPPPSGRHRADRNNCDWSRLHLCESWINAFTWSGALLLGWYASKFAFMCQKRSVADGSDCLFRRGYVRGFDTILHSRIVLAQPPVTLRNNYQTFHLEDLVRPAIGLRPLNAVNVSDERTPSDSESAEREFKDVLRSIENKLGIAAIQEGKAQEGLAMLKSSAQKNYAPAIFNLAVCYERGLGIKSDEKMAAELYKIAASRSHPGALYNLAVFYGQGRGGLARDPEAASDLLRIAAAKGQTEAVAALEVFEKRREKLEMENDAESTSSFLRMLGCDENVTRKETVLLF